jgi:15,16-dihydrobiliverdin:ferredoxin oxidoreductase
LLLGKALDFRKQSCFPSMMTRLIAVVAGAVALAFNAVEAYITSTSRSSFVGSRTPALSIAGSRSGLRMDTEAESIDYTARFQLEKMLLLELNTNAQQVSVNEAERQHGMPWKTSIDKSAFKDEDLLYMKFWEWHINFLQENLTDLKVVACSNRKTDFSYNENAKKKARIVNLHLTSKEYRKIRLTYYDAGETTQVYNAVLYPDPSYGHLPVLGVDLLAFNRKKYLAIVDFQPLHEDEADHAAEFSLLLQPIKESYENLSGRMSNKFYDETKFFSKQMLFARFEGENIVGDELFPAFQQYVQTHLNLIRSCPTDPCKTKDVLERQRAYDTYSAERDPATGLFTAMFGQEWAMDYVHDFLFSMSQRPAPGTVPVMPSFMGGGPPSQGGGKPGSGNPFAQQQGQKSSGGGNPFAAAGPSKSRETVTAR